MGLLCRPNRPLTSGVRGRGGGVRFLRCDAMPVLQTPMALLKNNKLVPIANNNKHILNKRNY